MAFKIPFLPIFYFLFPNFTPMTSLQPGQPAPDFTTTDQDGKAISLAQLRGKKVVLFFYPGDDTPTCTKEACNFRDNYALLEKEGYVLLGLSGDTAKSHQKFIKKYSLPFPLLIDEDRTIQNAYQVYGPKKFMGRDIISIHRTTYVIDEKGIIEKVIDKVKSAEAAEQVMG
ncbi:thioredoxin-dependent thiol peroxidase [soil metagenome]